MEGGFPFGKFKHNIYHTLDVMMFVEHQDALKFMFSVNKQSRHYITNNFISIRNGFNNDGLIDLNLTFDYESRSEYHIYE